MAAFPGGEFAAAVRALRSCPERIGKARMLAVVGRRDDERVVGEIQAVERVQNLRERLCPRETWRRAYVPKRRMRRFKVKSRFCVHAARDAAHHFVDLSHCVEVARKGNFAIVQIARSSLPPRRREPGAVRLDRRQVEEEWSGDQPRGTLSIRGRVRLRARHSSCIAVEESCVLLVEAPGRDGLLDS